MKALVSSASQRLKTWGSRTVKASKLSTHHQIHGSIMPVQSPGEQPARPIPEGATSLSRQHQRSCPPPSNPWGTATTNTPVKLGGRCETMYYILLQKSTGPLLYKRFSVSDPATLPLYTLRNFPQHAAAPQPPALLHTDSLGETDREKEKRGGGVVVVVLLSCCLTVLFVQLFPLPVHYRGNSWVYQNPHTHTLKILTSLIQSRKEGGNRGWTKAMGCKLELNEVWKAVVKALWSIATSIQTHSMPKGIQKLRTKEYKHAEIYIYTGRKHMVSNPTRQRKSNLRTVWCTEVEKCWREQVIVDYPFWLTNT